jgi:hypothetical protein
MIFASVTAPLKSQCTWPFSNKKAVPHECCPSRADRAGRAHSQHAAFAKLPACCHPPSEESKDKPNFLTRQTLFEPRAQALQEIWAPVLPLRIRHCNEVNVEHGYTTVFSFQLSGPRRVIFLLYFG